MNNNEGRAGDLLSFSLQQDASLNLKMKLFPAKRGTRSTPSPCMEDQLYSLVDETLSEVLGKVKVDKTKINALSIDDDVSNLKDKNSTLMAKLLEEIPKTLPNLIKIIFGLPDKLPNLAKLISFLDSYILEPLMGEHDLYNEVGEADICMATDKFSMRFFANKGRNWYPTWHKPLMERLLNKPNLVQLKCKEYRHPHVLNHIFSSSSIKDLWLVRFNNWIIDSETHHLEDVSMLLAALNDSKRKGRKRKKCDNGFAGALYQLEKLQLEDMLLWKHSCLLDLSETIKENNHLCHFVMDRVTLQEHHNQADQGLIEFTEAQLWEPFLDVLRNNRTLTNLRVTYYLPPSSQISMRQHSPYWEEHLFNILLEGNHQIASVSFGYIKGCGYNLIRFPGQSFEPAHQDNTQILLDLNYFGLASFGGVWRCWCK